MDVCAAPIVPYYRLRTSCLVTLPTSSLVAFRISLFSTGTNKTLYENVDQRTYLSGELQVHYPPPRRRPRLLTVLFPPNIKGRKLHPLSLKAIYICVFFFLLYF